MWALTFLFRCYYDPSPVCHVFSVLFCIRVSSKKLAAKKGLVLQEWKVKICFQKWKYLAEHANTELFFCCLFFSFFLSFTLCLSSSFSQLSSPFVWDANSRSRNGRRMAKLFLAYSKRWQRGMWRWRWQDFYLLLF